MIQRVTLKVHLEFEVTHSLLDYADPLLCNVKRALRNWADNSETGLCPQDAEGYTTRIVVFIDQVYKPEE